MVPNKDNIPSLVLSALDMIFHGVPGMDGHPANITIQILCVLAISVVPKNGKHFGNLVHFLSNGMPTPRTFFPITDFSGPFRIMLKFKSGIEGWSLIVLRLTFLSIKV